MRLQLGPVDREFDARVTFHAGPRGADIEAVEVRTDRGWLPRPDLIALIETCPALTDALRDHAAGRLADARCLARRL